MHVVIRHVLIPVKRGQSSTRPMRIDGFDTLVMSVAAPVVSWTLCWRCKWWWPEKRGSSVSGGDYSAQLSLAIRPIWSTFANRNTWIRTLRAETGKPTPLWNNQMKSINQLSSQTNTEFMSSSGTSLCNFFPVRRCTSVRAWTYFYKTDSTRWNQTSPGTSGSSSSGWASSSTRSKRNASSVELLATNQTETMDYKPWWSILNKFHICRHSTSTFVAHNHQLASFFLGGTSSEE